MFISKTEAVPSNEVNKNGDERAVGIQAHYISRGCRKPYAVITNLKLRSFETRRPKNLRSEGDQTRGGAQRNQADPYSCGH